MVSRVHEVRVVRSPEENGQFLHSDEKHPACHFYARGRCRNGDTCKFSHAEEVVAAKPVCHFFVKGECKNGDTCRFLHQQQEEETIDSPKALVIFLERLSHHKGARFCLEALLKQKESVRDFLGDLGFCDITKLYSILDRCGKVDDKKEYEELISTLGRSLVMKSLFHIGYITRETDLIVCTKVLVDAARLGRGCDWGLPIALLRRRIKELKIDSSIPAPCVSPTLKVFVSSCASVQYFIGGVLQQEFALLSLHACARGCMEFLLCPVILTIEIA
ncbi:hypothetical protein Pmar_PMAR011857 [Perkinsus marinus ATCC 50983]|uniref:C3H1-type domain-containing protein n=1 Tax=Perkinsus marinus (strain ATCC 50983 / TXsc) TaxID=423536 RepID=C5LBI7_PERM5|nr:hypothetical protein Pmar_PMAR011857 [Perkinsus marinus ATCC 50983]EER05808.1 hypothetical protein Pmar_PMAR011857 [Perkinsus marinus ATCC 50983]|eukprot:XP_002773992.1 hypothetical protein Pmar_PMAR011857 [Perkinsus marinus ATCC 50983]